MSLDNTIHVHHVVHHVVHDSQEILHSDIVKAYIFFPISYYIIAIISYKLDYIILT